MRPHRAFKIVAGVVALGALAGPAAAQGFFGWFGGQDDRYPQRNSWSGGERQEPWSPPQRQQAPQVRIYSDPRPATQERHGGARTPSIGGSTGHTVAYCVRLCDGRYFPMQRVSNATSIQLCNAFCPAAKTQVFNGTEIDHAVAANGARYTNLQNAFVYHEKIIPNCTCNGQNEFGLAKIDIKSDPTLKPGDIVSTGNNQQAALLAAANRNVRPTVTANAALRGKSQKSDDPDSEEKPED